MGDHRREQNNAQQGNTFTSAPRWFGGGGFGGFTGAGPTALANLVMPNPIPVAGAPVPAPVSTAHLVNPGLSGVKPTVSAPTVGQPSIPAMVPPGVPPSYGATPMGQPASPMGGPGQGSPVSHQSLAAALAAALAGRPDIIGPGGYLQIF